MRTNRITLSLLFLFCSIIICVGQPAPKKFCLADGDNAVNIVVSDDDWDGVIRAAGDLCKDVESVSGVAPRLINQAPKAKFKKGKSNTPNISSNNIIIGTIGKSSIIDRYISDGKIDVSEIKGEWESYIIEEVDGDLIVVGSDKRGSIYGIYTISEKIGVSPWYWWADVPAKHSNPLYISSERFIQPSPKVKYRGLFINDEAPCLTTWVKNTYGTDYGDHRFYARVFELILRLKGNFLWPAMWGWAFYADDPLNSQIADQMGVVIGTSHHEPMARNHQEWARKRSEYGEWNYATNQKVIDNFFREGIERIKDTEDIVTIGMRGDGDAPMGGEEGKDHEYIPEYQKILNLLQKIFDNQQNIIEEVTGEKASNRPQVWALYKEVQQYYDLGLRPPKDAIILLSDDNWGDIRRLPTKEELNHSGGWGMYYHVDYVGAPRNSKWLNITQIQSMWDQLQLTYDYGVDKLWVLNVGDIKPMEFPISFFFDMAWDPKRHHADNLSLFTQKFCNESFGQEQGEEAAYILNLCCKYNGRSTAEMLDKDVYNLETGEWKRVVDEYNALEVRALRQYISLKEEYKDAYKQLILFPLQAMANLHQMYYAQAMNHKLYQEGDPDANSWADAVERAFARDKELCDDYNTQMAGGKWNGMMIQKHIGYTDWNDNFPADILPQVYRFEKPQKELGGYLFNCDSGYISIEAEHCFEAKDGDGCVWTINHDLGRTLSGISLIPYTQSTKGAYISYKMDIPEGVDSVSVHIVVKSTLPFHSPKGHHYSVEFEGGEAQIVNFNKNLNENPENVYSIYYPTVARRVVESIVKMAIPQANDDSHTLTIRPMDPGIVFEKIVIDYGGYKKSYLFMDESPKKYLWD